MQNADLTRAERRTQSDLAEAKPHRWALSFWARAYRRLARAWDVNKHVRRFCRPLTSASPTPRGGGREALAYSQWLLHNRWSLLIFPEGRRSRSGELMPFHGGPAILALGQHVPVLPLCIKGASGILPPGSQRSRPAPVQVRIGKALTFSEGTSIPEAKQAMEEA